MSSPLLELKNVRRTSASSGEPGLEARPGSASLGEALQMALRSQRHDRIRTAFTLLGSSVGVAAAVVLKAIPQGAEQDVIEGILAMGTDLLAVMRGSCNVQGSAAVVTSLLLSIHRHDRLFGNLVELF